MPPNVLVKFLFHDISFLWHDFFFGTTFFGGCTTFFEGARLFSFSTTFSFRHDFFFLARLFFFRHDFFFSARLFFFGTTLFFSPRLFLFGTTSCSRHNFFYSTLQVTAELSQFHFIRKFNMVATGCLKCRFLLFLLLISFSTCTGVLPTYTPHLNVERGDLIERYFHLGLGYSEILLFLGSLHGCFLSLRQLKRIQ